MLHRHRQFVANYVLSGGNGVKAVYAAGYQQGYNSACVTASRLLRNANVIQRLEKHAMKAQMKADEVLEELTSVAQSDIEKYSASDKLKALELLGKFHKLFTDRTETVDLTEHEGARTFIANEIASLSGDPIEREAELQRLFANKTAPNYDPKLDVSQNPQTWPSGRSLLTENDLDPVSKAVN